MRHSPGPVAHVLCWCQGVQGHAAGRCPQGCVQLLQAPAAACSLVLGPWASVPRLRTLALGATVGGSKQEQEQQEQSQLLAKGSWGHMNEGGCSSSIWPAGELC